MDFSPRFAGSSTFRQVAHILRPFHSAPMVLIEFFGFDFHVLDGKAPTNRFDSARMSTVRSSRRLGWFRGQRTTLSRQKVRRSISNARPAPFHANQVSPRRPKKEQRFMQMSRTAIPDHIDTPGSLSLSNLLMQMMLLALVNPDGAFPPKVALYFERRHLRMQIRCLGSSATAAAAAEKNATR